MITSKQANAVACFYEGYPVGFPLSSNDIESMSQALEAYEQSKWVKFDINDKNTHPKNLQHVIVLYHTGTVGSDKWSILNTWMFSGCKECVTHWMPLPEFNELNK
jgi:hypothetical protein